MAEIRISEELYNKIDSICASENWGTYEFSQHLLAVALDDFMLIRSGGVIARFPVEDIKKADPEKAEQFLIILKELIKKLYDLDANIEFPILNVIEAYEKALHGEEGAETVTDDDKEDK